MSKQERKVTIHAEELGRRLAVRLRSAEAMIRDKADDGADPVDLVACVAPLIVVAAFKDIGSIHLAGCLNAAFDHMLEILAEAKEVEGC